MVDVNVNFQDTVRLVEKLIELRKENWEVATYPVEDHGFEREESWADEYKRILKLFVTNLKPDVRLPASGRARSKYQATRFLVAGTPRQHGAQAPKVIFAPNER